MVDQTMMAIVMPRRSLNGDWSPGLALSPSQFNLKRFWTCPRRAEKGCSFREFSNSHEAKALTGRPTEAATAIEIEEKVKGD